MEDKRIAALEAKLDTIISLLQRMPEIQAAAFLMMSDEKEKAALQGKKAADLWIIPKPEER